jgi:hypothetical protein
MDSARVKGWRRVHLKSLNKWRYGANRLTPKGNTMSIDWNLGIEMWKGVYRLGKGFETAIYDDEMSYSDIQILPPLPFLFYFIFYPGFGLFFLFRSLLLFSPVVKKYWFCFLCRFMLKSLYQAFLVVFETIPRAFPSPWPCAVWSFSLPFLSIP